ncbi:MAG TPA: glycosyl hydrolase family 28-related protein [Longimicrobium sp.]|nr:glycosyl hydrolase family 28-related protein [Longimicrobium sp.]
MQLMAITDVIIDKGATAADKGGMVFNVRAYGALGGATDTNTTDDTAAFKAAIAAAAAQVTTSPVSETAGSGNGGVVFVPQGIYRITDTLNVPEGVSILGAGMHTSQILFSMSASKDGLVWSTPIPGPFGQGGFLEDIDIKAEKYDEGKAAQSLVVLSHWANFGFNRVRVLGATAYNVGILNCLNISAFHLLARAARTSNLWIGASSETVTTTCRFVSCYFQASLQGPCADVAGLALSFDGCVFEDAGNTVPAAGYGIRIRRGTATLTGPYFEANRSWDLIAGTDVVEANSTESASVAVLNPVVLPLHDAQGVLVKEPNTGALRFERGSAFVQGGNYAQSPRPLVFTTGMDMVQAAGAFYPGVPQVEGGTFANLPGTVLYKKPATGQVVQAGNVVYGINP